MGTHFHLSTAKPPVGLVSCCISKLTSAPQSKGTHLAVTTSSHPCLCRRAEVPSQQPGAVGHSCQERCGAGQGPPHCQEDTPTNREWQLGELTRLANTTSCILHHIFEVTSPLFAEEWGISYGLKATITR